MLGSAVQFAEYNFNHACRPIFLLDSELSNTQ